MRKLVLGITLVALLVPAIPVQATHCNFPTKSLNHRCDVTFAGGNVPCAVGCAYWTDTANTDIDGDGNPDVYFQACDAPFPPGSFSDRAIVAPSPTATTVLLFWFAVYPLSDWDSFVCGPNDPTGGPGGEQIAIGANQIGELCDNVTGSNSPVPFGCKEYTLIKIAKGQSLVMRVYNWSDIPGDVLSLKGAYTFCDPFAANADACAKSG